MMTVKSDDIEGRQRVYAQIVQGENISYRGRTAAFDGLCCEIRGLGLELALGKVVDTFDSDVNMVDRLCSHGGSTDESSLEPGEDFDSADSTSGSSAQVQWQEIPAGDYVPELSKKLTPVITELTVGRHGSKDKVVWSDGPLVDAPEVNEENDSDEESQALLDAFLEEETAEIFHPKLREFPSPNLSDDGTISKNHTEDTDDEFEGDDE
jgi:hypothetical protein